MIYAKRVMFLLLIFCLLLSLSATALAAEEGKDPFNTNTRAANETVTIFKDGTLLLDLNGGGKTGAFMWLATAYLDDAVRSGVMTQELPNGNAKWIYCIDYYRSAVAGSYEGQALTDSYYWLYSLTKAARDGITHALIYGCPNYSDPVLGSGELFTYAATQLIIWEYQLGERTSPEQTVSFFSAMLRSNTHLRRAYEGILALMAQHDSAPIFDVDTITLKGYGEENAVTVTDTTGQLGNDLWQAVGSGGLHVSQSGNTLTLWADRGFVNGATASITLCRALNVVAGGALTVQAGSNGQQVLIGIPDDPISAQLSVTMQAGGSMVAQKTSSTGDVVGYCFKIYSWSQGKSWYAKTDAMGRLCISDSSYSTIGSQYFDDFMDGDYSFLEVLSQKGAGFVFPEYWKLTVTDSQGTITYDRTYSREELSTDVNGDCRLEKVPLSGLTGGGALTMTIHNVPQVADLKLIKTSPDGKVEGITFLLKDSTGKELQRAVTDASGTLCFSSLVIGQNYIVTELVPDGYVCTENDKEVTIQEGTNTVRFENTPLLSLKIVKKSEDGNVAGIVFRIYRRKSAVTTGRAWRTVVSDKNGIIRIDGLSAGFYWIEEVVPEGYVPQAVKEITITTENTVQNPAVVSFDNQLIRGSISVHKYDLSGTPLAGATFLLEYSKDGGATWSAVIPAAEGDKGTGTCSGVDATGKITTGEDGTALFSELIVYGVSYRLTETAATEGYQLLAEPVFTGELTGSSPQNFALSFDVVNAPLLQMPPTGGRGQFQVIASAATALLLSVLLAAVLLFRKNPQPL